MANEHAFPVPLSSLVAHAKSLGHQASMAHSDADINYALLTGGDLSPDPIVELRQRIRETIAANWNRFEGLMDPECQACYLKGQTQCPDFVAVHHWMAIERLYYGVKR